MKAGISNVWFLGMIITFIFLFSCYVTISVNYTRSFKIKNEVLSIIERGKGVTVGGSAYGQATTYAGDHGCDSKLKTGAKVTCNVPTLQTINLYMLGNAYQAMGYCKPDDANAKGAPTGWYGVKDLEKASVEEVKSDQRYYYCFAKYLFTQVLDSEEVRSNKYSSYYYKVIVFYKMEFPVLENWLHVKVEGETAPILDVQDGNRWYVHESV